MRDFKSNAAFIAQAIISSVAVIGAATLILFSTDARPHQAIPTAGSPAGWAYGIECCSNNDCREATSSEIAETPEGYVVRISNTLIPYNDRRIKQSGDEFFHICTAGGKPDGRVLCVYVPPRSF